MSSLDHIEVTQNHPLGYPTAGATLTVGVLSVVLTEQDKCDLTTALSPRVYHLYWMLDARTERTVLVTTDWDTVRVGTLIAQNDNPDGLDMDTLRLRTWVRSSYSVTHIWRGDRAMTQAEVVEDAARGRHEDNDRRDCPGVHPWMPWT